MKLKQKGLKLGLALAAAGLLSAPAHAADGFDGFDGAVEPMALGAALPLAAEVQAAALEQQVGSATPLPVTAAAASSSGPLGVEGSAALAAFSAADIATLFEPSAAPLQLAALSEREMRETDGALLPLIAFSAGVGGVTQGVGFIGGVVMGNHAWNSRRFAGNVATGALIGASFGPALHFVRGSQLGTRIWQFNVNTANSGFNLAWHRR